MAVNTRHDCRRLEYVIANMSSRTDQDDDVSSRTIFLGIELRSNQEDQDDDVVVVVVGLGGGRS